jgi:hypothetical protein
MNPLTVDPMHAGLAEIVSSLPLSLTHRPGSPQIVSIEGNTNWPQQTRAALDAGSLAAVVSSPCLDDCHLLSSSAVGRVVLAWDFAGNLGVLRAAEITASMSGKAVLGEAILTIDEARDVVPCLLDVLVTVTRLVGDIRSLKTIYRDRSGWYLSARFDNDAPFSISIIHSGALPPQLRIRVRTDDGGLDALIPDPRTAAPAEIRIAMPEGELLLPTYWESSRRTSWRRAVAVASQTESSSDIHEFHRVAANFPL